MQKYRVGILGTANIAKRSIAPNIDKHPRLEMYAVASRDIDKAKEFVSGYSFCKVEKDYLSLCRSSEIDIIYCPLPNSLHYTWVMEALRSGKHVICEKSLGVDLAEVETMVKTAQENNLLLLENFQFRFHRQTKVIKEILDNKQLGKIRCVRVQFGFPPFPDGNKNIRYSLNLGGGSLLDAGAYTLKALKVYFPSEIFRVVSANLFNETSEVDIYGGITCVSDSGIVAQLSFGFDNYYQCGFSFWGQNGLLSTNRAFTAGENVKTTLQLDTDGNTECIQLEPDNHFANMLTHAVSLIENGNFASEYDQCILQAKMINEVKLLCYEK